MLCNDTMKTIDEIRRDKLLLAIEIAGSASKLSELAGVSSQYISQIKSRTPESKTGKPKAMGDSVARKIEAALGKSTGWMDFAGQNIEGRDIIRREELHPEHIQAVIDLMYSADERGMRKIRDAAEDALDKYRLQQNQLGVEIKPTARASAPTPKKQSPEKPMHFEGSMQDFAGASIGGVAGRDIVNKDK